MDERLAPEQYDTLPDIPEPRENPFRAGHDEIAGRIATAYRAGKLHHALLFAGPAGVGKATLAFHIAHHLLANRDAASAHESIVEPDPASGLWRQIASGAHPGILHLARPFDDKRKLFKTVITVEEVRRVSRFLSHTAHDGGYRVVIVDPADDMNTAAANALLKNLEEPPRKTLFILVSHSPGRLLPTIRSRCQVHRFAPLGHEDLERVLRAVGAELPQDAAGRSALFDLAQGSARTAFLLTQYGGLEIATATDEVIDAPSFDVLAADKIAQALAGRDASIQFDIFNRHAAERVARAASASAQTGDSGRATRLSELWSETASTIRDTETYNLDKRQHVMGLLHRLNADLAGR